MTEGQSSADEDPVIGDSPFRGKSAGPAGTESRADLPVKRAGTDRHEACLSMDPRIGTAADPAHDTPDPTVPASDSSSNCWVLRLEAQIRADLRTGSVLQQAVLPVTRNCGNRIRRPVTGIQPFLSAQDPCIK